MTGLGKNRRSECQDARIDKLMTSAHGGLEGNTKIKIKKVMLKVDRAHAHTCERVELHPRKVIMSSQEHRNKPQLHKYSSLSAIISSNSGVVAQQFQF